MRVVHIAGNTTIEVDLSQMCPDLTCHPQMVNNDIVSMKSSPLNHENIMRFFFGLLTIENMCLLSCSWLSSVITEVMR